MGSTQNLFVFNPILMKLGEVVVSMGLKFWHFGGVKVGLKFDFGGKT